MENDADKKFTWVVKNFSSLQSNTIGSTPFVIGGCKWQLVGRRKGGYKANFLSLWLMVYGFKTLPNGWRRRTKFRLTVVNQLSEKLSQRHEKELWFEKKVPLLGCVEMLRLTELHAENGGFLVNDELKIVAEVEVLEVVGILDVSEESQEVTQPPKRIKLNNDDGAVSSSLKESIDVNGFQVLPSQVESVKRIFERHPDMALEFRAKNQTLRTSCINVLLNLIETLCQSLQDLSTDDLSQAEKVVSYLKFSGFKVDWLKQKLEQLKEKKREEQNGETRMQELEEELKVSKKKCSDIEALLEKEKAKVLAARAPPLTLDDLV